MTIQTTSQQPLFIPLLFGLFVLALACQPQSPPANKDKKTKRQEPAKSNPDESPKDASKDGDDDGPPPGKSLFGRLKGAVLGNKAEIAVTRATIKSLQTALEAYNTDVGFYPKDPGNQVGADIPDFLFVALHHKPTATLGGGPNSPYFDAELNRIGLFNEKGQVKALDAKTPINTATFQKKHRARQKSEVGPFHSLSEKALNGKLVFLDPWGNPYHYREWSSKPKATKEKWTKAKDPKKTPYNWNTVDIWSNGPDGINNYGDPKSDDITSWSH